MLVTGPGTGLGGLYHRYKRAAEIVNWKTFPPFMRTVLYNPGFHAGRLEEFLPRLSFDSWLACMYVTPSHRPAEILFRNGNCSNDETLTAIVSPLRLVKIRSPTSRNLTAGISKHPGL
jgi:hypothetical protein